jgi:fumarylacetoacetate (FAA) hydrolase family protein
VTAPGGGGLPASPSAASSRWTAWGSVTAPRIRRGPPQRGQTRTSSANTRRRSGAQGQLAGQAIRRYHRYPDGLVLFIGTMFAPVADRGAPGSGFTHKWGDVVSIRSPEIGRLVNEVVACDVAEPWSFGTGALMTSLARRGRLPA